MKLLPNGSAGLDTKCSSLCTQLFVLALFVGCAAFLPKAQAQRVALVIGNSAYSTKPLRNPVNDAIDVGSELRQNGFDVKLHTDLSRRGLNKAVQEFSQQARNAQLAVVYFAGHGLQSARENYLIPVDAVIGSEWDIRTEGIPLQEVLTRLDDAKVQRTVVILDACRDSPFQFAKNSRSIARGLAPIEATSGSTVVAFSTADGKTAHDGEGRNGVYTAVLLQQLRNRHQDIRDLLDETANEVARVSSDQRPKVYGDTGAFKGVFLTVNVVAPQLNAPPSVATTTSEDEAWKEVKDSQNVLQLEAFNSLFKDGKYSARVKIRIAALKAEHSKALTPSNTEVSSKITGASISQNASVSAVEMPTTPMSTSEFSRGEREALTQPCISRLRLPSKADMFHFNIQNTDSIRYIHLPSTSSRVKSIETIGDSAIRVVVTPSEDDSGTFLCVLRKSTGSDPNQPKELMRGDREASSYACVQRLHLPPSEGTFGYDLMVQNPSRLVHFPLASKRVVSIERTESSKVRIAVSASEDQGGTFLCVIR